MHITHRARAAAAGAAAALTLVGLLTGCSSSGGSGTTTITLSMQNANVEKSDPATWAIVQAFEKKYPDIKVTVSGEAVAQHLQKISIAAQSHTLPDVFWVYKANAETLEKSGDLLDLAPILKADGLYGKLPDSTVQNFTDGSKLYGVPYQGLLTGIWINTKILEDNGLSRPTTFDDLVADAKALHAKGITTISNGASQSSFSVWSFLRDLDNFGYESVYKDILSGKKSYDNAEFLKLYQHIAELRDAGAFSSNVSTQTYAQAVTEFTNGNAAMLDAGVWASSAIQSSSIAADTVFWQGPTFSDGVGDQNLVMNVASAPLVVSSAVSKDSAKLAAVKKFLAFYYGDQGQQILVDNGQPPVTSYSAQIDATKQSALKSALDVAQDSSLSSPLSQPDLVVPTAVANAMYDSIYGVIEGQLTPKAAVDLVQTAFVAARG